VCHFEEDTASYSVGDSYAKLIGSHATVRGLVLAGERPLLAESGPSKSPKFAHPNVRFREKRTFGGSETA